MRPVEHEEMLSQVHEFGRYNVYVPGTPDDATSAIEDEAVLLADRVEKWRKAATVEA